MSISITTSQRAAIDAARAWYDAPEGSLVFRLFGYAGTGKTTIAKTIADTIAADTGKSVRYAAFTGKAASVMASKGCEGASTIHRLIYRATYDEYIHKVTHEIVSRSHVEGCGEWDSYAGYGDPRFDVGSDTLKKDKVALIVIDECSMVGNKLGEDLMSYRIPILVLGDPAQLPPVGDGGYFTSGIPDVLLEEIHRQQEGCGILDLATAIRTGSGIRIGTYSESRVVGMRDQGTLDPLAFDQIIVGMNRTRHTWNSKARKLLGFKGRYPEVGERLIVLQNNREVGIMNGEQVTVKEVRSAAGTEVPWMELVVEWDGKPVPMLVARHYFDTPDEKPRYFDSDLVYADFAYAITCHKSQGSQWPRVLVIDESRVFRDDAARWLYTAITRAAKHVTVVK